MSHKDRSIANSRQESKRIYYQRREIKKLQQEITQLKKELEIITFNYQSLSSACGVLAEHMGLDKYSIIDEMIFKCIKDKKEKYLYRSVLKEIRLFCDYLLNNDKVSINGKVYYKTFDDDIVTEKFKEIIDKGIKKED